MRVGINATFLTNRPSGAKNRFLKIYIPLIKKKKSISFTIFEPKNFSIKKIYKNIKNLTFVKTNISNNSKIQKIFYQYFYWRKIINKYKFDVFENFTFPIIKNNFGKTITTIHDLRYLYNFSRYVDKILFKFLISISLNKNDFIFVVSNTIKNELSNFFPKKKLLQFLIVYQIKKLRLKKALNKDIKLKKNLFLVLDI